MRNVGWIFFCLIVFTAVAGPEFGSVAVAQEQQAGGSFVSSDEYGFINPFKWAALVALVLLWVWTTDWVGRDVTELKLPPAQWVGTNMLIFGLLYWWFVAPIPMFLGFPLLIIVWLVPLFIYIQKRNELVELHERVMTKDHLRYVFSKLSGGKMSAERLQPWQEGPNIELKAMGADEATNNENLYKVRKAPEAYVAVKELVVEAFTRRSTRVMMDFTKDSVAFRYFIDGVWHNGQAREREPTDLMLAVMKTLANLKPEDRRNRQEGSFGAKFPDHKKPLDCNILSQGTKTGERVMLIIQGQPEKLETLADIGMRDQMIERFRELMRSDKGLIVISGKPEGGLSTTFRVSLNSTDRLIRDFSGLEPEGSGEADVMNVAYKTYNLNKPGQAPEELLPAIIRNQPDAIVVRQIENLDTLEMLVDQANKKLIIFTSIHAREAVEALLRVLAMKIDPEAYTEAVVCALNVRLCRRLCPQCKEAFQPSPALLKKLGIPPESCEVLYKTPTPPGPDDPPREPCTKCDDIGYFGRIGIFELAEVDDRMREVMIKQPKLETLRAASKAAGNRTMQEEGIRLVATGVTSLEEVGRALKEA